MNNDDWIYFTSEYTFLRNHKDDSITFKTFDEFWDAFNKYSYLVPTNDMTNEEIEKFKIQLEDNARIVYETFNKGLN